MLKKVFLILFFIPLLVKAQEKEFNKKPCWSLSIIPEINGLLVDRTLGQRSKTRICFSAGINVKRSLNKMFSLISGVGYGIMRYDYIKDFSYDIDPLIGFIPSSEIETKFSFNKLTIPLLIEFDLNPRNFFITSGIEGSYFFENQSKKTINYRNGDKENITNGKNKSIINFAYVLSLGYNFYNTEKVKLSIEPMIKCYLKEYIVQHSALYSFGFKLTCYKNN